MLSVCLDMMMQTKNSDKWHWDTNRPFQEIWQNEGFWVIVILNMKDLSDLLTASSIRDLLVVPNFMVNDA